MDKRKLRKHMRDLTAASGAERASFSYAACLRALTHPAYAHAERILCYAAMQTELTVQPFINTALLAGKRVAFPVCLDGHDMEAWEPMDDEAWTVDRYGIRTPIRERSRLILPGALDLILVPGLAFDKAGGRLGRGAGYYDRYFTKTRAFRMGICMDMQFVDAVPMDAHDKYMHAVCTNTLCYIC